MLMALNIPLPSIFLPTDGGSTGGAKMSKSSGTGINPMDYMEKYGVDTFRYFLAREMVVGLDATFSHDAFVRRNNSDLANDSR
jgi:methionyl-tRNA synthetase